jgi:predicted dehydrogenase
MPKIYRLGVLGCGAVWNYHRLALDHLANLKCVCLFDPVADRAAAAAAATGARVAQSPEQVLQAPDVDIVAVLTPAATHAAFVETGAAAGKHFMLEKPMANSLADAQRIVDAIRKAGVKCYHPTLRALGSDMFDKFRELTAPDGVLGTVRSASFDSVSPPFGWAPWFEDRTRCLLTAEYGSHVVDTFIALTGDEPEWVWSHADRYCREFNQDDIFTVNVRFRGHRFLQMNINWTVKPEWKYAASRFNIVCDRGVIVHNWFSCTWHGDQITGSFASERAGTQGNRWDHYRALIQAIETGTELSPNECDGLNYVRIIDAGVRSNATGTQIHLGGIR